MRRTNDSFPVPAVKMSPPQRSRATIERTVLTRRITAAATAKLVLVRAPAGFGKTTAMLQSCEHLRNSGIATAWMTVDAADNDAPRFLGCLTEVVSQMQFVPDLESEHIDVIDALAREAPPFVLFIDDFELVQSSAVSDLVREIIEHLPRNGRLVIGTRSLPDLGLGRLRARGHLAEIDAEQLRFTFEETVEYLQLRGCPSLTPELLGKLFQKTEGWVAALWLASLTLEQHSSSVDGASEFINRFSGSNRSIAEFLTEDVIAWQPADVRHFLLRTSVLRQFNVSLCAALMPDIDCARMLERLEASALFLSRVDGENVTFRYHSLFAEHLRAQLADEHGEELKALHLSASKWYESEERPVPAIDHALEGGDASRAMALISLHAGHFLEAGRMRLLARWFSALPTETLALNSQLQVVSIWALCFTQGPQEALHRLDLCSDDGFDDPLIRAHVNALHPLLLAMMDRYEEAYPIGQTNLTLLPTQVPFADSVLINVMARIVAVLGHQREALRLLDTARKRLQKSDFNRMYSETTEGMIDLEHGRLRQATARFRMAIDSNTHGRSYTHTSGNAWAGVLYAAAIYETGDLEQAERLLNVYLPLARDVFLPDHMVVSHQLRSRLALHRGDVDLSLRALSELEYLGHQQNLPRVTASAKLERARLLLLQGHAAASLDELDRADDIEVWQRVRLQRLAAHDTEDIEIGRIRWAIHFGDADEAIRLIKDRLVEALSAGRLRRALKLRILLSLGLWRRGAHRAAIEATIELVGDASKEGFFRLLLDEGQAVAAPVRESLKAVQEAQQNSDPIAMEYLQRLAKFFGPPAPTDHAEHAAGTDSIEPLTRTEIRVLKLLAEGHSNGTLAERLFVSDSTVRTHLRSINAKLAAKSRMQAVSIARRAGLIA